MFPASGGARILPRRAGRRKRLAQLHRPNLFACSFRCRIARREGAVSELLRGAMHCGGALRCGLHWALYLGEHQSSIKRCQTHFVIRGVVLRALTHSSRALTQFLRTSCHSHRASDMAAHSLRGRWSIESCAVQSTATPTQCDQSMRLRCSRDLDQRPRE